MKLSLQTLTGTKYFIEVEPQDKVRKVKVRIFTDLEIKSRVRLLWQNKQLEDSITLAAQGINEDATIQMIIEPDGGFLVEIKTYKKGPIFIRLSDSSTVHDLLRKVRISGWLQVAHISDFYFGDIHLSDEKLPFHLYGICQGSVIDQHYEGSFELQIDDARKFTFMRYITVNGTDTIKRLKEKILKLLNDEREEDELKLMGDDIVMFHSKHNSTCSTFDELDRVTWTINQCQIKPLDRIRILHYHDDSGSGGQIADVEVERNISINISGTTKRQRVIRTERLYGLYDRETVHSLQLKIQHQLHIPFQRQNISITGMNEELNHGTKLSTDKFDNILIKVLDFW